MNHVTLRELVEWFLLSMFAIFSLGGFYIDHASKYAKHTDNDDWDDIDPDHFHTHDETPEPHNDDCDTAREHLRTHDEEHQTQ